MLISLSGSSEDSNSSCYFAEQQVNICLNLYLKAVFCLIGEWGCVSVFGFRNEMSCYKMVQISELRLDYIYKIEGAARLERKNRRSTIKLFLEGNISFFLLPHMYVKVLNYVTIDGFNRRQFGVKYSGIIETNSRITHLHIWPKFYTYLVS